MLEIVEAQRVHSSRYADLTLELGHSTAKLTLDTYRHLMGTDADRAALDRVNKVLGNPAGTQDPKSSTSAADE